jgi:hypothetical protein
MGDLGLAPASESCIHFFHLAAGTPEAGGCSRWTTREAKRIVPIPRTLQ